MGWEGGGQEEHGVCGALCWRGEGRVLKFFLGAPACEANFCNPTYYRDRSPQNRKRHEVRLAEYHPTIPYRFGLQSLNPVPVNSFTSWLLGGSGGIDPKSSSCVS